MRVSKSARRKRVSGGLTVSSVGDASFFPLYFPAMICKSVLLFSEVL